jgi:Fasciclin domain
LAEISDLSVVAALVHQSGLEPEFGNSDLRITLFAPSNEAFLRLAPLEVIQLDGGVGMIHRGHVTSSTQFCQSYHYHQNVQH